MSKAKLEGFLIGFSNVTSYLLGFIMGDGYLWNYGRGYRVMANIGNDYEFGKKLQRYIKDELGLNSFIYKRKGKNSFDLRISSKALYFKFRQYKPASYNSHYWRVHENIFAADYDIKSAFLRGIFDAEGSVNPWVISLDIVCKEAIEDLKSLLKSLHIESKIHRYTESLTGYKPRAIFYRLTISGKENLTKYAQKVGFFIDRKQAKLSQQLMSYKRDYHIGRYCEFLEVFRKKEQVSTKELREHFGCNPKVVSYTLKSLKKKGLVDLVSYGGGKPSVWRLVK
jgi:intein/homing endonuclease